SDLGPVMAYRALRFARNDSTALPGFDENLFADHSGAGQRSLEDILAELRIVREGSKLLFDSFDETAMRRSGIMYKIELPVLAVGFTLIGHQIHHFRVMTERYFPLLQTA
ncbi:MAG: DinB family protein, partial [Phycisphaerae bacterium]|nr:DinB family protein [Saprospiraceae bacterium]